MKALGRLKGALHLLLLTVFITYSCLFTLSYLNQFRPEALPAPIPALPLDSTWINNDAIKKDGRPGMSLSQGDIFTYGGNSLQKEALLEKFDDGGNIRLISQLEGSLRGNLEDETVENEADNGKKNGEKNKENFSKKNKKKENVWPIVLEPSDGAFLYEINLSEYSKEDQSILKSRLDVMVDRAKLVGKVCRNQPHHLHKPSGANHLVWDTKHHPNIVWCPNYKVASTSMMMSFMRLTPKSSGLKSKKIVTQSEVRKEFWSPKTGRAKAEIFRNSLRVIIVRHPFTRLLSAYRDKMTKVKVGPPKFEYPKLQKKIIAQYRSKNSSTDSEFPTFAEFVQYVIDETRGLSSTQDWREKVNCWVTYWARCNVCTTDYNIIIKLETMSEDKKFLVTLANLNELKKASSDEWRHLRNATSQDLAPEYYGQLTRQQMLQLYESYKLDFELFGYDVQEYLDLV